MTKTGRTARRATIVVLVAAAAASASFAATDERTTDATLEQTSIEDGRAFRVDGSLDAVDDFSVVAVRLGVAPRDEPARGTRDAPVVMSKDAPRAHPALRRDAWTLTFHLESRAGSQPEARIYVAELEFDGEPAGAVTLARAAGDGVVAVRLVFPLGAVLRSSSTYALSVRSLAPDTATAPG